MKTIKLLSLSLIATLIFSACSDDDDAPEIINEEEFITTLNVFLTPQDGGEQVTFTYRDLSGDGSNVEVSVPNLQANTTYVGRTEFLNEIENENITEEVLNEAEEHQVFYLTENSLNANTSYNDEDANGNPIGISFTLTTGEASQGNFTVILIHEGDKSAPGASEGELSPAVGGETDIEVIFDVTVE